MKEESSINKVEKVVIEVEFLRCYYKRKERGLK
jgi:hypothetical protein